MKDRDAIQMMESCKQEIEDLRAQVAMLAAKAEAFDAVQQVLGFIPQRSRGEGEDLVWKLGREIISLVDKMEAEKNQECDQAAVDA